MRKTVIVNEIRLGERARMDLGDMTDLVDSIRHLGLLQPIVITADNQLIAGHRRLESVRRLGWDEVEATVAEHIHDAVDLLKAERDENTCRKPMTASELIALGRQIEALEKPKAAEALRRGQLRGAATTAGRLSVPANEEPSERFDSREKAAEAVGLSTATYSRIKQVTNGADGYEVSKGQRIPVSLERQADSKEALELMDRITAGEEVRPADGGRPLTVTAVYEKWKGHKTNRGDEAPAERRRPEVIAPPTVPLLDGRGRRGPQRSQRKSLAEGMAALSGLCAGFASVNDLDESINAEEAARWARDLSEALRVLRSLNNKLKEHANGNH
ncbi:ParB N-terminal domain-containing protein [Streptomyces sp. NPDC047706]|uniref:ParB N-terminal domain-containing protein n=1 Tax=Streptomyces sp. NPDC047706 TaxID=3365486 RepID=UPI0037103588